MKNTIREFLIWTAIVMSALLLSFDDYIEASDIECSELFEIVAHEVDQDENSYWAIRVTQFMQNNGSDAMCERFGKCVLDLMSTASSMVAVEIVNPEDEWVPSARRWITADWAMVLAGVADLEEQAMMSQDSYTPYEKYDP